MRAGERREQILEVAKDVFAKRGCRVANVADICTAARIGRGTLYQYFDNKDAVLLALVDGIAARVERVLKERPKIEKTPGLDQLPRELIARFCKVRMRQVVDAVFADEASLKLIVRDAHGVAGAVDRVIEKIDELVLGAMVEDLEAGMALGLVRKHDAHAVATFYLGGIQKLALATLQSDNAVDLDAIVDLAIDLELFGLLKRR
jgi:AcrR family transcriptional regulator